MKKGNKNKAILEENKMPWESHVSFHSRMEELIPFTKQKPPMIQPK